MSPIILLTGLLALAYFGSMLVGGRTIRGFGLPSGTEFLLLGILIGPNFMGVFTRHGLGSFDAITLVALAWLTLVLGSHYGSTGQGRVTARRMLAGIALATMSAIMTGVPAAAVAFLLTDLAWRDLLLLALGAGAVSAETTRHAVRWVTQRYSAEGPLTRLVGDVVEADDAVPIVMLAVMAVIAPSQTGIALPGMPWSGFAATLAIGVALGATCAALFDIEPRPSQRWGILLGTGLLTIGVSVRLGLSAVSATFVMGIVAARLAKERGALQTQLGTTERAVMLPALVLTGAYVTFPARMPFVPIALAVVAARFLAKQLSGRLMARTLDGPKVSGTTLGVGLMPSGVLSISIALAFELRYPGLMSEWIMLLAVIHAIIGEITGPALLFRALRSAGEVAESAAASTPLRKARAPAPAIRARKPSRLVRTTTGRTRSVPPVGMSDRRRSKPEIGR